ncbi:MAG: cytochrome c biogenesis protein CcdA [bacterium]
MTEVSWALAFGAGILTFFSPCILPLLPAYMSFITGKAVEEILADRPVSKEILPPVLLFCLGFSSIFVILGATATTLGRIMGANQRALEILGGLVVIIFGLHQLGLIRASFLQREMRFHLRGRPAHGLGAFLVGVAFAAGWTPCLGPVLGSILAYAGTRETVEQGVVLLCLFSLGLSLPFVALGFATGAILPRLRAASRFMFWIRLGSGCALVVLGLLLVGNQMSYLMRFLS